MLEPTPLKCSQYTLMSVDTGINSSCMHRNLMIQHKLILINYTTAVDDFNKKLTIITIIQQNYKHVFRTYTTIESSWSVSLHPSDTKQTEKTQYIMVRFQYETCLTFLIESWVQPSVRRWSCSLSGSVTITASIVPIVKLTWKAC